MYIQFVCIYMYVCTYNIYIYNIYNIYIYMYMYVYIHNKL